MTTRLYYKDPYTTTFKANIVERFQYRGKLAVILDNSYFYPTSGGQPHDTGTLNDLPVVNVLVRPEDNAVAHIINGEIWTDEVTGQIDWPRRFDHMQQHTGQHILSQAFLKAAEAETLSFHLGSESATIDLNNTGLKPTDIEKAELIANRVIWENRLVTARMVDRTEADKLPLRKIPDVDDEQLRIVSVTDFDLTACGGTHVSQTGEIGLIKIVKLERRKDELRVEFLCGRRALVDYRQKNRIVNQLANELTTGYAEIEASVVRLRDEAKQSRRLLKQQLAHSLAIEAGYLIKHGTQKGDAVIVSEVFSGRDPAEVKMLANQIIQQHPKSAALLGVVGDTTQLIFARSEEAAGDMNQLLKQSLQVLGSATGGGTAKFAQGGGGAATVERMNQALQRAVRLLVAQSD
jgi:alanyl-tRNA synthetase